MSPLLEVEDLRVQFENPDGVVHAVNGVSYSVGAGRTVGIAGESGSGKTAASLAILGLTEGPSARISGRVLFEGRDLLALTPAELRSIRGNEIGMAFQDPLASLHPFYKVGAQVIEAIVTHRQVSKAAARDRAIDMLELVGIPDSHRRVDCYPDQLSTAMRRRAMLAMALANEPKLLIADEPTNGLDLTERAAILALLQVVKRRLGMATIVITRDPVAVAALADEIYVMSAGRMVERTAQSSST